ncbi:hypothetical protein ACFX2I_025768 [Malus domestica]
MRPATSSFLSITCLARVMSKSPKRHEPCDSPSTAPQHHNPWPQPYKLPLVLAKSSSLKQWSLPQYLFNPCRADSWPMPADVLHHPDGCPEVAPSKKKTRKINFFLPQCGTKKTKKATKDGPLHGQDVENC